MVVAGAMSAALWGTGAVSAWKASETAPAAPVTTGRLAIDLAAAGSASLDSDFGTISDPVAAGDSKTEYVDLLNSGDIDLGKVTVSVTTEGGDEVLGAAVEFSIQACTGGVWNTTTGACPGTITTAIAAASTSGTVTTTVAPGARLSLKLVTTLPDNAPFGVAGKTAALTYQFVAEQRAGAIK